jgi:hypothetical protein
MIKRILITVAFFLVALVVGQSIYKGSVSRGHGLNKATPAPQQPATVAPKAAAPTQPQVVPASFRPLNMALIRGGFTSAEQFYQRVQADPVLRSFYGTCTDPAATLKPISDDLLVFVTFRRGDTIKWASKPLLIHQGEYVYTFCGKTVLARCGNLISWSPKQPSEDVPPSLLEIPTDVIDPPLELQASRGELSPMAAAAISPAVAAGGHHFWFIPPFYIPPSSGGSTHFIPTGGPVAAISGDEFDGHAALFTLLAGFLAIALLKLAVR